MKKSILCVLLLAAGCAKAPGDIAASAVSVDPYMGMSCEQLASERASKQAQLDHHAKEQKDISDRDAAWMAIVHVPVASMSRGDREPQIATLKGQVNAIDHASRAKACG